MKILFIPDVHGSPDWENVINFSIFDLVIFLGDYNDSFTYTRKQQWENFQKIVYLKNNYKDKVILLAGNHDNHYIYYHTNIFNEIKCSGYSASAAWKNNALFRNNINLFQAAWKHDNIIVTHAGIVDEHFQSDILPIWDKSIPLDQFLNLLWIRRDLRIFKIGKRRGGYDEYGSIFWADKGELKEDPLKGFHQVVGHTPSRNLEFFSYNSNTKVTFTDCLNVHNRRTFYTINV